MEVNCATLHGDSAQSTLFGHLKGAFTGAATARPGLLRHADGGVLFLDEIGELGADEQAMLLKAVEEKRFYPLGSDREVASDFQLIAGTHRDLRADVARGRFRADLFARINLWSYHLPGLAERPEDIEPNLAHLLALHAAEHQHTARFNAEARTAYLRFAQGPDAPWPGNFRDLAASVTRLATLAEGGRIDLPLVQAETARLRWLWQHSGTTPASAAAHGTPAAGDDIDLLALLGAERLDATDLFDRLQLQAVVRACRAAPNLSEAGRRLFQATRTQRRMVNDADRLRKYLLRFGLSWDEVTRTG